MFGKKTLTHIQNSTKLTETIGPTPSPSSRRKKTPTNLYHTKNVKNNN